ncbi:transmembrane protein, putative (macronuclear) [Tetrahymena thermophila SB210]|uniref:Transmembrane protein, putative n=1 Tax=Tetrahymena thermophila (strain SB210) TaxID=312017 RepID=Q23UI6_TETTS|nr:transmembrane protein, putative [Tetrahymena thermophila SB210]EAS00172.1 transmembrane protein, putative [Tetrahymena thermophila SB210]|eukprot:XP_001020417.1 transmembrane protein, putative [Tetrahymena thermophila SB210]
MQKSNNQSNKLINQMKLLTLALLTLLAIATVNAQTISASDLQKAAKILECSSKIANPCQPTDQPCLDEMQKVESCSDQCSESNQSIDSIYNCYKQECKSDNKDVQKYVDEQVACANSGIKILAITAIIGALAVFF